MATIVTPRSADHAPGHARWATPSRHRGATFGAEACLLTLFAACSGPTVPTEPPKHTGSTGPTGESAAVATTAGGTAETGSTPTGDTAAPGFPDGCDPRIGIPGVIEGEAVAPHAETYGAEPTPFGVHLGWPGHDPSVSAAFLWRTDVDTLASNLWLRPVGGAEQTVPGASLLVGTTTPARVHEVKICLGLQPGTTYEYRVGGEAAWSETYTFTTPPPADQVRSVRVVFAGDSRGSYAQWAVLVRQIAAADPDLVVFTGDAVGVGSSQVEWDLWFLAGKGLVESTPVVLAHGNHEGQSVNWFALMSWPDNELWFPVRYGPLQLLFLNDTAPQTELDTQALVIDEVFAKSDARWKVAVHHQPPWTTSSRHPSNLAVRATWTPVYDATGVDLVLSGHNHLYERSVPIRAGAEVDPASGVTYLVTGGAGAPLYLGATPQWYGSVFAEVEHYGIADFGPDEVAVDVRDWAGNVIDTFTLPAD